MESDRDDRGQTHRRILFALRARFDDCGVDLS